MPVTTLNNNIFQIRDLKVDFDSTGHFLSLNPGHAAACVLCISRHKPIGIEDLQLTEQDLRNLFSGSRLDFPESGYSLQGITRMQISASAQYRNFTLEPPAYVHVWSMADTQGGIALYVPPQRMEQCVLVPVKYCVRYQETGFTLWLQRADGYRDGALLYRVENRSPIPIPATAVGQFQPMRPGVRPEVFCSKEAENKYILSDPT